MNSWMKADVHLGWYTIHNVPLAKYCIPLNCRLGWMNPIGCGNSFLRLNVWHRNWRTRINFRWVWNLWSMMLCSVEHLSDSEWTPLGAGIQLRYCSVDWCIIHLKMNPIGRGNSSQSVLGWLLFVIHFYRMNPIRDGNSYGPHFEFCRKMLAPMCMALEWIRLKMEFIPPFD